jgi:hypothetical protein
VLISAHLGLKCSIPSVRVDAQSHTGYGVGLPEPVRGSDPNLTPAQIVCSNRPRARRNHRVRRVRRSPKRKDVKQDDVGSGVGSADADVVELARRGGG